MVFITAMLQVSSWKDNLEALLTTSMRQVVAAALVWTVASCIFSAMKFNANRKLRQNIL